MKSEKRKPKPKLKLKPPSIMIEPKRDLTLANTTRALRIAARTAGEEKKGDPGCSRSTSRPTWSLSSASAKKARQALPLPWLSGWSPAASAAWAAPAAPAAPPESDRISPVSLGSTRTSRQYPA